MQSNSKQRAISDVLRQEIVDGKFSETRRLPSEHQLIRTSRTCVTNVVEIDSPPLWWPNGAGEQRFYTFTVDVNGEKVTRRIGLRKIEVLNERSVSKDGKDELSLVFRVNNRRLFI